MRVLVACEFSGIVRDAFAVRGHDAWSCDLLPSERNGKHMQCDAIEAAHAHDWDLMIAHPPCTYLAYAGAANWNDPGREEKRLRALQFFIDLYNAPIARICVENPHGYPRKAFRRPDQEIHPYYFGKPQMKRTCLWLKNLPRLRWELEDGLFWKRTATEKPKPSWVRKDGNPQYFCAVNRTAKARSKTFQSIAQAMAEQWGAPDNTAQPVRDILLKAITKD